MTATRLGARIRELRLARGLSQRDIAKRAGMFRGNIARLELGYHWPTAPSLIRLAAALEVPVCEIMKVLDG